MEAQIIKLTKGSKSWHRHQADITESTCYIKVEHQAQAEHSAENLSSPSTNNHQLEQLMCTHK